MDQAPDVAKEPAEPAVFPPPSRPAPDRAVVAAPAPDPSPGRASRRVVRWIDTSITLLLVSAVAGVLLVAMPPIFRAAGLGVEPRAITPARISQPHRPPPPFFHEDADDEEDPVDDLMQPPGLPGQHGRADLPGFGDPRHPAPGTDSASPDPEKPAVRMGLARHGLKLRERPGEGTEITGAVREGEVVMIMKDLGEWVLIMHSGDHDMSMGWTKRSEIAVR